MRAEGLRPRGDQLPLRANESLMLPSDFPDVVGSPDLSCFRGSIPRPHVPLSTLSQPPYES